MQCKKSGKKTLKAKHWTATIFSDGVEKYIGNVDEEYKAGMLIYSIAGQEVCPSTGREHLQAYLEFKSDRSLNALKKKFGDSIHFEKRKGTRKQAMDYCKKDGDFEEWGTFVDTKQGQRTDLEKVHEMVRSGCRQLEIEDAIAGNYQAQRYMESLLKSQKKTRNCKPTVWWFWGPTGTGKTRVAIEEAGNDYWISMGSLRWWDRYDGQKTIIIDDFRPSYCSFENLLRYLDRYDIQVETKGGTRWLMAETIIITAPKSPQDLYDNHTYEDIEQLIRRIDHIIHFGNEVEYEVEGNTGASTSIDYEHAF